MAQQPNNSGGNVSAPYRAPAAKVIAGALANNKVAQSLINALGVRSINAIVATSTSPTANFANLQVGDYVVHMAAGSTSPLGNAAGYAILGASAVTGSTGSGSTLTGNLGIYPNNATSITNFPPSTYTGVENAGNAAAHAAQTDAQTAFTSMQTMGLAGTTIASALDGQTLTPGAYKFSSGAATLDGGGALTFNGSGMYIIYTASTLTTGSSGTPVMTLASGATAANIFWIIGSSATINSGFSGIFQGNVIAQASVTVTDGGTVDGGLIALTGGVTLSNTTAVNTESSAGGQVSYSTIATAGNLGMAAVVGDLYLDLAVVNLDSNNPLIPPPPAQLTARHTGDGGLDF
jgi:hypothetical protein